MAIDFIIASFVLAFGTVLVIINALKNRQSNQSNNDGGLPIEFDFPELDLPPGVTLPVNGPSVEEREKVGAH
ncbi:hypothetical protein OKW21_003741 [Catalinimonas alkaloidigena]|uniref:hypothetical protein n=1 Tax=Catalinimonas alkaloidigena TaxID=1075417 RepID=UPI002406D2A9|nr:hypothetical protein [Catalinimonas alkaloidigena]MDF9798478.1 hypothetical protein [Catalinimonas alkaloidigena]